jgi:hypothetical protein
VVDAARSEAGLGPAQVDADLVEQARRLQLVKRTLLDTRDPQRLLEVFSGDAGPDRQYSPSERPRRQLERATRGLRAVLGGRCKAKRWDQARAGRVAFLTAPVEGGPDAVNAGAAALRARLAGAEAALVTCDKGMVAMLVVPGPDGRKLVDLFPPDRGALEVNPNERTMK